MDAEKTLDDFSNSEFMDYFETYNGQRVLRHIAKNFEPDDIFVQIDIIRWIQDNFEPGDVFDNDDLVDWYEERFGSD